MKNDKCKRTNFIHNFLAENDNESLNDEEIDDTYESSSDSDENEEEELFDSSVSQIPLNILLPRTFYFDKYFNIITKL